MVRSMNGILAARSSISRTRSMPARPATIPAAVNSEAGEVMLVAPPSASHKAMAAATDAHAMTVRRSVRSMRRRYWRANQPRAGIFGGESSGRPELLAAGDAGRSCVFMHQTCLGKLCPCCEEGPATAVTFQQGQALIHPIGL